MDLESTLSNLVPDSLKLHAEAWLKQHRPRTREQCVKMYMKMSKRELAEKLTNTTFIGDPEVLHEEMASEARMLKTT